MLRKILDQLAENPIFLRYARWAYCRGAAGIPPSPMRLVWGAAARFAAFAVVFDGCRVLARARGGAWEATGGFLVALLAWAVSSVAARLARGYPVLIGLETEPMARLRTQQSNGTLKPLLLTRLTSHEVFAGFAWPDYLVALTLIVEHLPLAWFVPRHFWTHTIGIPPQAVWVALPLAAADMALYFIAMNLGYWRRSLQAPRRFAAWRMLGDAGVLIALLAQLGLIVALWLHLKRGWTALLAVGFIEGLSAWWRVAHVRRVWRRLSDDFWELVRRLDER